MAEFNHNGVTIELTPTGKFVATISGDRVIKNSLDAIKKAIDADKSSSFKSFMALIELTWECSMDGVGERIPGTYLVRVKIEGVTPPNKRKRYFDKRNPIVNGTVIEVRNVYLDTPKVIAIAKKKYKLLEDNRKAQEAFDDAELKLEGELEKNEIDIENET
jgi:hypothetical protein